MARTHQRSRSALHDHGGRLSSGSRSRYGRVHPRAAQGGIRRVYAEEVDRTHRSLLNAAIAFAVTFGILRGLTYGIKHRLLPWGDLESGGLHIHHFVWGVALLLIVGLVNLVVDSPRLNPWLGAAYGTGAALVIDEFALLLNLRDVYWSTEGRVSVDVALGTMALAAVYFAATSFWRRLGRELAQGVWRRAARGRQSRSAERPRK
jgi:hypothetical protein